CTAVFIGVGNVVDDNADVRENLISLTLETRAPDNLALGKKSSFLSPTDIIAEANNPKVAIIWIGMPYGDEWVYSTENIDTLCVTPDIKASWPLKISFNLKDPPDVTAHLKDHPESKVAVGFFVLFNDGNRNGQFDEYVEILDGKVYPYSTPIGPYDYFDKYRITGNDTVISPPMQSLTQREKDWVIGCSVRHGIVWASDQRACDWLNKKFTSQEILDKGIEFETRYAALWDIYSEQPQPIDEVQFFDGIRTGYNLVNADQLEMYTDSIGRTTEKKFNPLTKQWMVYQTDKTYNYYVTGKFSRIDQSTIIPVIVTDDRDEFFKFAIWDG
ncbi:MAG: hypothetical protein ACM31E_07170, partial [Fibrobacterota bacterium]